MRGDILKNSRFKIRKLIVFLIVAAVVLNSAIVVFAMGNSRSINSFKEAFSSGEYDKAYSIYSKISSKGTKNVGYISEYLNSELDEIKNEYIGKKIDDSQLEIKLNEIIKYPVNREKILEIEKAVVEIKTSREHYKKALQLKDEGNFEGAIKEIESMSKIDPDIRDAQTLNIRLLDDFKTSLYNNAEEVYKSKNISWAISILESKLDYFKDNKEYKEKIDFYKEEKAKEDKLAEEKRKKAEEAKRKAEEERKAALAAPFTNNNDQESRINSLNLNSSTSYLVWVDIQSQMTYIFKGYTNHWDLVQAFQSSTGKSGSDTPRGIFKVNGRGTWFFSNKYQQGGKYWVRFLGNYLFHSLPMDNGQNVVDPTLGVAASHGCVRLSVDNSKWIYYNIPNGTTVYIK